MKTAQPAVEIRGISKTFHIAKRKKASNVDLNTATAFFTMLRNAFPGRSESENPGVVHLRALDEIDLTIMPGEVLGIIGRNGAGKSTLLKILARVLDPTEGRVDITGRVVSLLELGIGFAPDLTVRENIRLYGQLAGLSAAKVRKSERAILEMAELTEHGDVPLNHCPGGSFVRLAFATMMGVEADIILADEVLAVGDAKFRAACERRILDVARTGETVLFVSHDMEAIKRMCSRVIWIDHGRIRMAGNTLEVVDAYTADLLKGRPKPAKSGAIEEAADAIDLRLTSIKGTPIGALQLNMPAYLEALFRVEQPNVHARVQFEVVHGKKVVFAVTSPWAPRSTNARTLSSKLFLPADFFNETTYKTRARIYLTSDGIEEVAATTKFDSLTFQVMNTDLESSVWAGWNWSRPGSASPRLTWSRQEI